MVEPDRRPSASMPSMRAPERSSTDIGGFFSIVIGNAARIALITLAVSGLAVAYLAYATPVYTSSTSLFIDPRSRKVVADDMVQGNLGSDQILVESQIAIIGSDNVLRRVVQSQNLDRDEEFAPDPAAGIVAQIKRYFVTPRPVADAESRAINALSEALKVKRAQKTYVVDVQVSSKSAAKAARLSQAVVNAYLEDQAGAKSEEARRANELIDARLDELRAALRNAETKVDGFRKANKILTSEGGLVMEQQLTRLNAELATARAVAAETKARVDQVNAALANGGSPEYLPDAIRSNLIQRLREQLAQVARREAALSSQLQHRHPVLIEVKSQVAEIKAQINAELKRIATSAKSESQIATNRVAELERSLDRVKDDVSRANTAQIRLRELEQDATASRDVLNTFLTRAKQTQEQQNIALAEARVISPAIVPAKPSKPITPLVLALGLLGGLGLGIAYALLSDHLDKSLKTTAEVETRTGLRTLATLPVLGGARLGRVGREAIGFSDVMSATTEPRGSGNAHSYRQAVLRLLSRIKASTPAKRTTVAMVVSANSSAGASSTALAVAYAAAMSGERTLLIDAASQDVALSDALAANLEHQGVLVLDNKAHLQAITRRDQRSGLVFLPIGLADLRVLKAQQRKRLASGITAMAESYDLVVIDGGALLEDESAASLFGIANSIVVVARSGVTQGEALAEVCSTLAPVADRVLGTVLNMAPNETS